MDRAFRAVLSDSEADARSDAVRAFDDARRRALWDRIDDARQELLLRPGSLTDAEQGRVSAYNDVLRWMGPR